MMKTVLSVVESVMDKTLTVLFTPLKLVGVKKCERCFVRVRLAQLGLLTTIPIAFFPSVSRARGRWDIVAHPAKRKLMPATDLVSVRKYHSVPVLEALNNWVKYHSSPDEPILIYGGKDYTPREILQQVEDKTQMGLLLTHFLVENSNKYHVSISRLINGNTYKIQKEKLTKKPS